MPEQVYNYPVWGTQGGGLARRVGDDYFFITEPGVSTLHVGDIVPQEWDLAPANDLAREEMMQDEFGLEQD